MLGKERSESSGRSGGYIVWETSSTLMVFGTDGPFSLYALHAIGIPKRTARETSLHDFSLVAAHFFMDELGEYTATMWRPVPSVQVVAVRAWHISLQKSRSANESCARSINVLMLMPPGSLFQSGVLPTTPLETSAADVCPAWCMSTIRTASVVVSMSPPLAFLTIIAAAVFYWQLKDVDDFSNMGRDIRLVGAALLGSSRKQRTFDASWSCVEQIPGRDGDLPRHGEEPSNGQACKDVGTLSNYISQELNCEHSMRT